MSNPATKPTNGLLLGDTAAYRWAFAAALMCFPLIWVGGLVTTHDAGMAVPDWPGTYGYNLFLYPISTWISGPFDLLVEHGHRLLGALVGFLAIGLVVTVWRTHMTNATRWWSTLLLASICAQGALGGIRVLQTNRVMAMVHGCTGPLVFALACFVALKIARERQSPRDSCVSAANPTGSGGISFVVLLTIVAFLQLVLGAGLRHLNVTLKPVQFMALTHMHLTVAVCLTIGVFLMFGMAWWSRHTEAKTLPFRQAWLLLLFVSIQVFLGCLTWYVNYALPWSDLSPTLSAHVNHLKGLSETMIVTAHQAMGSLILITLVIAAFRTYERTQTPQGSKA